MRLKGEKGEPDIKANIKSEDKPTKNKMEKGINIYTQNGLVTNNL